MKNKEKNVLQPHILTKYHEIDVLDRNGAIKKKQCFLWGPHVWHKITRWTFLCKTLLKNWNNNLISQKSGGAKAPPAPVSLVKNSIPYFQFLRLRRLCSDNSRFFIKIRGNVQFLQQTWLSCFCCSSGPSSRPTNWSTVSTTNVAKRQQRYNSIHPHNHAVKSIILKNFILQNDPDTGRIFSQPPLISFKRDKNRQRFSQIVFQTSDQPGTFKCSRARCKTCPFIRNVEKISGPKRSSQCHLLHNLRSLQKVIHRRNRETTWRPIPRLPSWH